MLATMIQTELDTMDNEQLLAACFAPLIRAYKEIVTREEDFVDALYHKLSNGQQALFIFMAYYNHVKNSAADLYWWSAYFMAQTPRWSGLKNSFRFFGDDTALQLLEDIEHILKSYKHPKPIHSFDVSLNDLDCDPELHSCIQPLAVRFNEVMPDTLQIIADYIRGSLTAFVQLNHS